MHKEVMSATTIPGPQILSSADTSAKTETKPIMDPLPKIINDVQKELDKIGLTLKGIQCKEIDLVAYRDVIQLFEDRATKLKEMRPDCAKLRAEYERHLNEFKFIIEEHKKSLNGGIKNWKN